MRICIAWLINFVNFVSERVVRLSSSGRSHSAATMVRHNRTFSLSNAIAKIRPKIKKISYGSPTVGYYANVRNILFYILFKFSKNLIYFFLLIALIFRTCLL